MSSHALQSSDRSKELEQICRALLASPELQSKHDIQTVSALLGGKEALTDDYARPGDDCAAFALGNGYQLLAIEGMLPEFVRNDPWHAGWSSVMANVSDIAAMGGRPTAIVNAFWHNQQQQANLMLQGIRKACEVFGITLAGGHTSLSASCQPGLAVAILGHSRRLLSCHHIRPGQRLYMVADLNGKWHGDKPYWNTLSGRTATQIRAKWNLLPELADTGFICAAKDISNGGLFGTLLMMLELRHLGATIDINAIPRPDGETDLLRWLQAFQSFGFLLSGDPEYLSDVLHHFQDSGISCAPIGTITESPRLILDDQGATVEFWDFDKRSLTGMTATAQEAASCPQ